MSRYRIILAVLLLVGGFGYLVYTASRAEGVVYKGTEEIRAALNLERNYRITGLVKEGTLDRDLAARRADFVIIDHAGGEMRISYTGPVPDTLRERSEVVVAGRYEREADRLRATELIAKCPSKYQAHPDTVALPSNATDAS
jgi:cytochrome c-type biogenesis protein CcmE